MYVFPEVVVAACGSNSYVDELKGKVMDNPVVEETFGAGNFFRPRR